MSQFGQNLNILNVSNVPRVSMWSKFECLQYAQCRLKIRMTDSALWWTYLAVVFVHQLPDSSDVSFWIKFFAKNFLYKWDLKFKASSDLICTLIWPQTASKCDTPSSQKLIFKIKFFLHLSIFWISPLWMHFLTRGQWWQRAWE